MSSIQRSLVTGLALGLLLCSVACGGREEPAETAAQPEAKPAAQPAEVPKAATDESGEQEEIRYSGETDRGEKFTAQIGGDIDLPSALTPDLPLYPNAVAYSSMEITDTAFVSFDSWDEPSSVYRFFTEKLPAAGWKIDDEINMGGQRMIKASKDGRQAEVRVEATADGARISYVVQPAG